MKKTYANLICSILFISTANASENHTTDEWKLNRLLSPTLQELQSEIVFRHITCYGPVDETIINLALDHQFERIEYMDFGQKSEISEND